MATTRKGWRALTVDGESYRWIIRRQAKYWDNLTHKSMRFTVESSQGALLVVELNRPRIDSWGCPWVAAELWAVAPQPEELRPITPAEVVQEIRRALYEGWNSQTKAKPFVVKSTMSGPQCRTRISP